MKYYNKYFLVFSYLLLTANCYGLSMSKHVVEHFKKTICQCCEDALTIKGEFKNNGYYVNLKNGDIKGHSFSNVIIKFEDLTEKSRKDLLNDGVLFSSLQEKCTIKLAGDIKPSEFQEIIDKEIGRSSLAKRIFNNAQFEFCDNYVNVTGSINLKRVPGNPFAILSNDSFVPFNAKITASLDGSIINIHIIECNVNNEECTPELKQVFLNWLNPLWDFSKLGFNCNVSEYKISPNGLRIVATIF